MPYVQSHTNLRLHPKTEQLRSALSIASADPALSRAATVGYLHLLWHWTLEYSPRGEGNLSRFSATQIAAAAEWPHDPDAFVRALTDAGFLDAEPLAIHDWWDYAGEMLRKRQQRAQQRTQQPTPPPAPPPAPATEPAGFASIRALQRQQRQSKTPKTPPITRDTTP